MSKTLTLRIDDKTYSAIAKQAKTENRSLANFVETAVKAHIQESAFLDDVEMADILSHEHLVKRLRQGSKDARARKGIVIG
ncbi:MAG TPA: YlcI/YnfO family protein [Nitrospira sp.]|nr:YlcI/YnfO family protein [Nitrospira sp.]